MAQHRVELVQLVHALGNFVGANAGLIGQRRLLRVVVRQEFMQRRIEEPNGGRQPLEFGEHAQEVLTLVREKFIERSLSIFGFVGQDHLAHGIDTIAFKKHVLGSAQPDA